MACFNPLDRGNLNQIKPNLIPKGVIHGMFQSPRSGKFESNLWNRGKLMEGIIAVSIP